MLLAVHASLWVSDATNPRVICLEVLNLSLRSLDRLVCNHNLLIWTFKGNTHKLLTRDTDAHECVYKITLSR